MFGYGRAMEYFDFALTPEGATARELPPGRSHAVGRHLAEARGRGARPVPLPDEGALGWVAYLSMAYDAGLLEPRPRPSRTEPGEMVRPAIWPLPDRDGLVILYSGDPME